MDVESRRAPGLFGGRKKNRNKGPVAGYLLSGEEANEKFYSTPVASAVEKDLRMEFQINTPFSIPSDNADHRVAISTYEMKANYEYHTVPKLDPSVYLVAQISGWEKTKNWWLIANAARKKAKHAPLAAEQNMKYNGISRCAIMAEPAFRLS